jgi:hypothetical protein
MNHITLGFTEDIRPAALLTEVDLRMRTQSLVKELSLRPVPVTGSAGMLLVARYEAICPSQSIRFTVVTLARDGEVKVWQPAFTNPTANPTTSTLKLLYSFDIGWSVSGAFSSRAMWLPPAPKVCSCTPCDAYHLIRKVLIISTALIFISVITRFFRVVIFGSSLTKPHNPSGLPDIEKAA